MRKLVLTTIVAVLAGGLGGTVVWAATINGTANSDVLRSHPGEGRLPAALTPHVATDQHTDADGIAPPGRNTILRPGYRPPTIAAP